MPCPTQWLSAVLPAVTGGCRLSGIGTAARRGSNPGNTGAAAGAGAGYARVVLANPKQGEACPVTDAPVSLADEAPYLLTNLASLADLNARLQRRGQQTVDMRRFRPNIVVNGAAAAWEEDTWKRIRLMTHLRTAGSRVGGGISGGASGVGKDGGGKDGKDGIDGPAGGVGSGVRMASGSGGAWVFGLPGAVRAVAVAASLAALSSAGLLWRKFSGKTSPESSRNFSA